MQTNPLPEHKLAASKLLKECSIVYQTESYCSSQVSAMYLRHSIPEESRNRMLDWMIEVLSKCGSNLYTFFISVSVLDRFFLLVDSTLSKRDLHITGIVAMDLAWKFENTKCMSLALFQKEIAHNKFSMDQLLKMEIKMLETLQFNIKPVLPIDALRYIAWYLSFPKFLIKISEILLILNRFDTALSLPPIEESLAILYLSSRSEGYTLLSEQVQRLSESLDEDIEYSSIYIQNRICEYKLSQPILKNLYKYLGFEFESIENRSFFKFYE